jgi:hypothetical protein
LSLNTEFKILVNTVTALLEKKNKSYSRILRSSNVSAEITDYDNWNGGTDIYTITVSLEINLYSEIEDKLEEYEKFLLDEFSFLIRDDENNIFSNLVIKPNIKNSINWGAIDVSIMKSDLIKLIDNIKSLMISVATNGPKIQTVNDEYRNNYYKLSGIFKSLIIENPNPYDDLWKWYGKWSAGDLPSYQSRRIFINDMYSDVLSIINSSPDRQGVSHPYEPTGWERVDRSVSELRKRINEATNEEQFQTIGLLSRETIISLAQEVYKPGIHKTLDAVEPSKTDANRMLEAFIATELGGGKNELLRRNVKSTLALANYLTHKRTATKDEASLCLISVMSLINTIKIVSKEDIIYF